METEKKRGPIPRGPFTVWVNYGYEGWQWADYSTLKDAIASDKYGSEWVLTKPINWLPQELPEPPE